MIDPKEIDKKLGLIGTAIEIYNRLDDELKVKVNIFEIIISLIESK